MITYKTKPLSMFLGIAILSLTVNITPVIAASGIVLVQSVGKVEIRTPQPDSWKPVNGGTVLSFGDVIRTGPQSKAEISFESGIIRMDENTIIEIPSKLQQTPVREGTEKLKNVLLMKGRSLFQVFKNRLQNGFEVTTPSIIAGVKGTTFSVSEEEGDKGVNVMEGTVVVTNRKFPKEAMEITSGHFTMLKNEHLTPAREIQKEKMPGLEERQKARIRHQERLTDLRQDIQDRTGAAGVAPGRSGNLPPGLGGTPPGLNGSLFPGPSGIPPGQVGR